ncbi:flagellar motor switch protein FliG [Geomicrobium sp. JCM 19055]|uniref:flagellar motor switch protein FliG n=1 Tax=Geomicrobium sp. JCM 19055 TaxID=1460649 RepID=UPI00045ED921|nr:flagellar motor switch protein FliG [Geomicrobium sp. JCM 19055]GAK00317.1 flagellar motor switch protein FliG [Geomicrobium sp. JCM 19055]
MVKTKKEITGKQKAAALLISLGPDVSAQVYKHLQQEEIEQLTLEIANVRKVENDIKESLIKEFHQLAVAQDYMTQGGIGYARDVLEKALGNDEAMAIISRLTSTLQVRPFDFARKSEPVQVLNFIQNEHPQTIALVLSYLDPDQSGQILSELPSDLQADVAKRIATMDRTSPEIISEVESVLEQKLASTFTHDYTEAGGIESVVEVLNSVDRSTERTILDSLEIQDPELAEEIKKRMFVFEDIVTLDNRSIQRIIRDVDNEDLQLSLKVASEEVREILFSNMSQRMAETFREEMEFMGPVRLKDVEDAQTRIVNAVRRLEEAGEIVIARGGGDDIVV